MIASAVTAAGIAARSAGRTAGIRSPAGIAARGAAGIRAGGRTAAIIPGTGIGAAGRTGNRGRGRRRCGLGLRLGFGVGLLLRRNGVVHRLHRVVHSDLLIRVLLRSRSRYRHPPEPSSRRPARFSGCRAWRCPAPSRRNRCRSCPRCPRWIAARPSRRPASSRPRNRSRHP